MIAPSAYAQNAADDDLTARLVLAEQMVEIRPVRDQVKTAIDQYVKITMADTTDQNRQKASLALMKIINIKALQQISIDAYAEVFTHGELQAMVEYHSKPEAQSASAKQADLAGKISPEIVRMLDQAMIRARTEAQKAQQKVQ